MEYNDRKENIISFLKGRLSPGKEMILLNWIKADHANRNFLTDIQSESAIDLIHKPDDETNEAWKSLYYRIKATENTGNTVSRLLMVAAFAATFILGALLTTVMIPEFSKKGKSQVEMLSVTVPYGAKSEFVLPDSTIVWLNSGSKFNYPSKFTHIREVTLSGEAYFKVKKNKTQFVVSTSYGKVEVLGTEFDLMAYTDNNMFSTTLITGSVRVSRNDNFISLRPGEQSYLSDNQLKVKKVNTELFTSWKDGKLIFEREPFPDLMLKLERWFNVKIDYTDPTLSKIWYTGTIEMETITEVMELVSRAAHVTYSFDNKTRVITIKSK
jgi:transmembrane sensor